MRVPVKGRYLSAWEKLLSEGRVPKPGKPKKEKPDLLRSPFEADYDRVIYSTPFRRLARKTQVHPLAQNDHVRNRLTHSLEVCGVGRSLGRKLAQFLKSRGDLPEGRTEEDLAWMMMAACAAHDIGNPPFGHAGEYAIREWISSHQGADDLFRDIPTNDPVWQDMTLFEGNAQGFRIAARPDNPKIGYLRLTYATLGTMIKYPWTSDDPRAKKKKKFNVFDTERAIFATMVEELGMRRDGRVIRHPASFLSEVADDICYRIMDLEDAVELGIVEASRIRPIYQGIINNRKATGGEIAVLRGQAIRALMEDALRVFKADYTAIMEGTRDSDLKSDWRPHIATGVKKVGRLYGEIFADRAKIAAELGAYKALGRIIRALCTATFALAKTKDYGAVEFVAARSLDLAWGREYATTHQTESYAWWLYQVMDYISGLTDNYARQLSREIDGTG